MVPPSLARSVQARRFSLTVDDRAEPSWVTIPESRSVEVRRTPAVLFKPFPSGWEIEVEASRS
jgi:hypothetical protein